MEAACCPSEFPWKSLSIVYQVDYLVDLLYWATSDDDSPYDHAVIEACDLDGKRRLTLAPTEDYLKRPFAWGITSVTSYDNIII